MQNKIFPWLKKHERILWAAVMALLPPLVCLVTCLLERRMPFDAYLPASEWNDELIYYKMVEGIVKFGYPQGYFGFNESHSALFSFAAWSPVLVWPWVLWGLIFGWHMYSPFVCNIVLLSLAMFLFVWLVHPTGRQKGILAVLFVAFPPFSRYMLSGMPEVICFAMVIVTLALIISYIEKERKRKLALLFVLTMIMTLMRPYLIVFMLFPMYFLQKKGKWAGLLGDLAILGGTAAGYAMIKTYFSAEYFTPLFRTEFIDAFRDEGLLAGIQNLIYQLLTESKEYFAILLEGFISGMAAGAYFASFWLVLLLLIIQALKSIHKKEKKQILLYGGLALCFFAMWIALLLMYKPFEGSKHLITFVVAGIFMISLMETRFYKKMILTAAVFFYLYSVFGETHPYDYQIPYVNEELKETVDYWQQVFLEEMTLQRETVPNYDNVVIWTLFDYDQADGTQYMTRWQYLYGLPEGYGISCCAPSYVMGHFEEIQSKYLVVLPGGEIEAFLAGKGIIPLAEDHNIVLYRLR